MAKPKSTHSKLPSRMVPRSWKTKRGETKTAYYYEYPRDDTGKRKLEPLGTDLAQAKIKWAKLEGVQTEKAPSGTVAHVYKQYMKWANNRESSGLSIRTIKDREAYWKKLKPVFAHIVIDELKPEWFLTYFDQRSSKVAAKKEIKFVSVLCNWAKSRGLMNKASPIYNGFTKQLKVDESRDIYVTDDEYNLVYECGDQVVKDAMEFTYMCGNRPDESVKAKKTDIINNELHIHLPKTEKKGNRVKRIPIDGDLKLFIERQKNKKVTSQYILSDEKGQPLSLTGQLRYRFKQARDLAEKKAKKRELSFRRFQLRDIRAKAGTDTALCDGIEAARKLLGHTTQKQTSDYIRPIAGEAAKALGKPEMAKVIGLDGESN